MTLLKRDLPELLVVHCLAHLLELSFRDVMKADPLYEKLSTLTIGAILLLQTKPKATQSVKTNIPGKINIHYLNENLQCRILVFLLL